MEIVTNNATLALYFVQTSQMMVKKMQILTLSLIY